MRIEPESVARFLESIQENSSLYFDPAEAKRSGFEACPVPPTYHSVILFQGYDGLFPELESKGIDTRRILHVRERYEYFAPLYQGQEIQLSGKIVDVKGDRRTMIQFESWIHLSTGEPISRGISTIFLMPVDRTGAESQGI